MFENYQFTASERFLRYVRVDTQSDSQSNSFPSTEKQKDLAKILAEELKRRMVGCIQRFHPQLGRFGNALG